LFSGVKQKKVRRDRALAARFMPGEAGEPATVKNPRPRAMTRPLALVIASSFGFSTSFYLMLSVVPLYATSVGAGKSGTGLATGALMLSTALAFDRHLEQEGFVREPEREPPRVVRVGYVRTSKKDQNPDLQRRALEDFGCGKTF
jgi:hypothetical protein